VYECVRTSASGQHFEEEMRSPLKILFRRFLIILIHSAASFRALQAPPYTILAGAGKVSHFPWHCSHTFLSRIVCSEKGPACRTVCLTGLRDIRLRSAARASLVESKIPHRRDQHARGGVLAMRAMAADDGGYVDLNTERVVICGAGNIGAALAYSLSKRGLPPLIIEPRGLPPRNDKLQRTFANSEEGQGEGRGQGMEGQEGKKEVFRQPIDRNVEPNFKDSGLLLPLLSKDSALEDLCVAAFELHQKMAAELSTPYRRIAHLHLCERLTPHLAH
jgi:hypothetical protein